MDNVKILSSVIKKRSNRSGWVFRKHAGFAPARQSLLGFRLRSPLPSVEEPCPLSLQTVFLNTQPDLSLIKDLVIL
jgi:hypothetical protein